MACVAFIPSGGVQALDARVNLIDARVQQGEWGGIHDDRIQLHGSADGAQGQALELSAISSVVFPTKCDGTSAAGTTFYLADGGELTGELVDRAGEGVRARTLLGPIELKFSSLAGIRFTDESDFAKAAEVFKEALAARKPGHDILVTRDATEVKSLRGTLQELDQEHGVFSFGDRPRSFQLDKIFGIAFAVGAGQSITYPASITLPNGGRFSGTLLSSDASVVHIAPSFGGELSIPVSEVCRIDIRSDRVVHVSDLVPNSEKVEGIVHDPWPVRRDRSASNTPLSIEGRVFDKGLGVHSRTELTYDVAGKFEAFTATIGLDDHVRPRGSVVFRVLGDGNVLFDSGPVKGSDAARNIEVPLTGVRSLTLLVDYGEGLDISDQADWGGARLLKPEKRGPGK